MILSTKSRNLIRFGYLSLMASWFICEIIGFILLGLNQSLTICHFGNYTYWADFPQFYMAGKVTCSSERNLLYSWDVQERILYSITSIHLTRADSATQYSPIVFLFMAPFSLLSVDYAQLLFDGISLLVGLFGYCMLARFWFDKKDAMVKWVLLGVLASFFSGVTLFHGQISWLYSGFACLYLAFMLRNENIFAAFCLAMTSVKPQYALMLLIPAFYLKRFRLLFYTSGWGLLFFIACISVFGTPAIINYPQVLNQVEGLVHIQSMCCLRPVLGTFLPNKLAYTFSILLLFAVFLFLLVFAMLNRNSQAEEKGSFIRWLLAVTVVATMLFSPHTHWHDLLLLMIPALLTLPFKEANQHSINLICWRIIFYSLPVISWACFFLVCARVSANFILIGIMAILFVCGFRQLLRYRTAN